MDSVELQPMTDEELAARGLTDHDVWMIKHGEEVYGPYEAHTLRQHAYENEAFYATLEASLVAEENWVPFFEATPFRKRTPKLISAATLQRPERFWIMLKGQRLGPHTHGEVQSLIDQHLLLSTDLVSGDEATSWQRVYELNYFTHVHHESSKLPQTLSPQFLEAWEAPTPQEIEEAQDPVRAGLASLAYVGSPQASSFNLEEVQLPESRPLINVAELAPRFSDKQKKYAAYASVAVVLFVGLVTLWPTPTPSEFEDTLADSSAPADYNEVELMPAGSSLLDEPTSERRVNRTRYPAANTPSAPSPRAMNGARRNLARMQESHNDYVEPPAEAEAPESGLYPEELPNELNAVETERKPSSEPEAADDGYRMEDADKTPEVAPVVEEVGDF